VLSRLFLLKLKSYGGLILISKDAILSAKKQAILTKMWGNESKSFAKFPDYIKRFKDADPRSFRLIKYNSGRSDTYQVFGE
jgi:hypothetical protein